MLRTKFVCTFINCVATVGQGLGRRCQCIAFFPSLSHGPKTVQLETARCHVTGFRKPLFLNWTAWCSRPGTGWVDVDARRRKIEQWIPVESTTSLLFLATTTAAAAVSGMFRPVMANSSRCQLSGSATERHRTRCNTSTLLPQNETTQRKDRTHSPPLASSRWKVSPGQTLFPRNERVTLTLHVVARSVRSVGEMHQLAAGHRSSVAHDHHQVLVANDCTTSDFTALFHN